MWHEMWPEVWQEYVMNDHCQEYENLTIEEKLLVDKEVRKWFASANLPDLCVPMFIFKEAERRIIEEFKRREEYGRRKSRDANANARVAGDKHNRHTRQRKGR